MEETTQARAAEAPPMTTEAVLIRRQQCVAGGAGSKAGALKAKGKLEIAGSSLANEWP